MKLELDTINSIFNTKITIFKECKRINCKICIEKINLLTDIKILINEMERRKNE